jgi:outer membrane protein
VRKVGKSMDLGKLACSTAICMVLAAFLIWPVLAQETGSVKPPEGDMTSLTPSALPAVLSLTPAQAAELAEQRAWEIRQAEESRVQAEAAVSQARSAKRLSGEVSLVEGRMGPKQTANVGGQTITLGSDTIRQATLSLLQPLYTGGRVESQVQAAQAGVSVAEAQTEITIRAIRRAAQEGVYGILRTEELAEVARRQVEVNQEHLRIARAMFSAGTVAQFEVVQGETQVASAEGNLVAATIAISQATAGLRRLLALPQTQEVEAVPPIEQVMRPTGELVELIAVAQDARPETTVLEAQVRMAEANLRLARATNNLTVGLAGQYQYNGATSSMASSNETWQVALSLTKPILDGGMRAARTEAASAALRSVQNALEIQREQIALEVTQQYLATNQALKQLQVATQGVVQAREAARIAQVRFSAGVGTGIEVIDAQTAQAAAEAAQVNAGYDLRLAILRLRDVMGQPLEGGATS